MKPSLLQITAFLSLISSMGLTSSSIIASYRNYYRGDDDFHAACLISDDGSGIILFDGVNPTPKPSHFRLSNADRTSLNNLLSQPAPANSKASTGIYPNIDDLPQTSGLRNKPGSFKDYYLEAENSAVSRLLKRVCRMEARE